VLPQLLVDDEVKSAIANAVNAGKKVTVSKSNITLNGWTGCGFVITDPVTGAGAYMISGGQNGAFIAMMVNLLISIYAPWVYTIVIIDILVHYDQQDWINFLYLFSLISGALTVVVFFPPLLAVLTGTALETAVGVWGWWFFGLVTYITGLVSAKITDSKSIHGEDQYV
jgi:hypothetical protein